MAMPKRPGLIVGTLLSMALLLSGIGQAFAAQPSEQQVRKLMDAIGLGRSMSQMNTQIAISMKQALPCVASNYWQDFINQAGSSEFIGRLVPIYQKHFTAEEVDGLVTFYSSPLGQKMLTEMPAASAEASQAGQQWSHEHGQQMIATLEHAGTLTADGRCPATGGAASASSSVSAPDVKVDTGTGDEDASPVPVITHTHGHASSRNTHKHAPVKKKSAAKKPVGKKSPSTKSGARTSNKTAPAKASSSKAAAKTKVTHTSPAAKPAKAAAAGN